MGTMMKGQGDLKGVCTLPKHNAKPGAKHSKVPNTTGAKVIACINWKVDQADKDAKQAALKKFVKRGEHGKLHLWLGIINRQIKGPFYFGEKPTYVDFALVGVLSAFTDYHRETIKVLGYDPVDEYSKVAKVRNELKKGRDGYSYAKVQKLCNGARWKEQYIVQPEVAKSVRT